MSKLRRVVLGLAVGAVLVGSAACIIISWWEGSDTSVTFTWTLNGSAPSPSACSAVGATRVRMWVSQARPTCTLGTATYSGACGTIAWEGDCAAGFADTGYDFAAVHMYYGWTLSGSDGRVLQPTEWYETTLTPGVVSLGQIQFTVTPGANAAAVSTWTIDGAAANATSCAAVGADRVYVYYRPHSGGTEQGMYWPCSAGSGTTGNLFQSGVEYDFRWTLVTGTGTVLSAAPGPSDWFNFTMVSGDNPFEPRFVTAGTPDGAVVSNWTINGLDASADTCTNSGGSNVYLLWRPTGGTEQSVYWPCNTPSGTTDTVLISGQGYQLRWELRNAAGEVISAAPGPSDWFSFTAVAGNNSYEAQFVVNAGRLDVTLQWADKVADPAYGSCTLPPTDVAVMGYLLENSTGAVLSEVDIATSAIACASSLAFGGLPYDTYTLAIDGRAASPGTAVWQGDCVGLGVDDLSTNAWTCQIPMVTP